MFALIYTNECVPFYSHRTSGFLSSTVLQNKTFNVNIFDDGRRNRQQRVFPDINFTCSGNLTKWIVGGTIGNRIGGEVQIWRRNIGSENDYTKVGYSILDATDPDNDNVYEHIPDPPLEFQEGDILGVYQRRGNNDRMSVFYQITTGPANYRNPDIFNINPPAPSTLNDPTLVAAQYDYPLVTVEICKHNDCIGNKFHYFNVAVSIPTSSVQAELSTFVSSISTQTVVLTSSSSIPTPSTSNCKTMHKSCLLCVE